MKIENFKSLDNKLLAFGLQPVDWVIMVLLFTIIHLFLNSLVVDIIVLAMVYYIAKKTKNRPSDIFITLFLFFTTPIYFSINSNKELKK